MIYKQQVMCLLDKTSLGWPTFKKDLFIEFSTNTDFKLNAGIVISVRSHFITRIEIRTIRTTFGRCPKFRLFSAIETT